jgi:hypothetical protein
MLGKGKYVASSTGSTAIVIHSTVDSVNDDRVAGHSEVIVCSPDTNSLLLIFGVGIGEFASKLLSAVTLKGEILC